jgi:hypothetical protein
MPNLDFKTGQNSLLALTPCVDALLQTREVLIGTLDPYASLADSALADMLEIISGLATELSVTIGSEDGGSFHFMLADEPLSFEDAVRDLPEFMRQISEFFKSAVDANAVSMCELACRAQTFSFYLREREPCDENDDRAE